MRKLGLSLIAVFLFCQTLVWAEVPVHISFSDRYISQLTGVPLDGTFVVTANLRSENNLLFSEQFPTARFSDGFFDLILGTTVSINPTVFNNPNVFLEIELVDERSTFSITSIPYAFRAKVSEQASFVSANVISGNFVNTINALARMSIASADLYVRGDPVDELLFHRTITNTTQVISSEIFGRLRLAGYLDANGHFTSLFNPSQNVNLVTDLSVALNNLSGMAPRVLTSLITHKANQRVGIGTTTPRHKLDVAGVVNATSLFLDGEPLADALSWRKGDSNQIFTSTNVEVAIGTQRSRGYALNVVGTVNATAITVSGNRLTAGFDWQPSGNNLIFNKGDGRVGIGTPAPEARLDVQRGGVRLGITASQNAGTLFWNGTSFRGVVSNNRESVSLFGVSGEGLANRPAIWAGPNDLTVSNSITTDGDFHYVASSGQLGLGTRLPIARVDIAQLLGDSDPFLLVRSTQDVPLVFVDSNGQVGIGTTQTQGAIRVSGNVDADRLTINGVPLRLAISTGTFWRLNPDNLSIFYDRDSVGIGRPDPNPKSTLELAQIPTRNQDPALTFTHNDGDFSFTMGVDIDDQGIFRVENGTDLGASTPLFAALDNRFGVGLARPDANLHVSGNLGLAVEGIFESTANIPVEGPGTRLIYFPAKAAFRAGQLTATSSLAGADWDSDNLGKASIGFGLNPNPSGNFASVMGGANNTAGGLSAIAFGGENNAAQGEFSFAAGRNARALHVGSFVWADAQATGMSSTFENQSIIVAKGGVGIGTNNTFEDVFGNNLASTLTLSALEGQSSLLRLFSPVNPSFSVLITPSGSFGIGVNDVGTSQLVVSRSVAIGTANATANLVVTHSDASGLDYSFLAIGHEGIASPAIMVTTTNHISMGRLLPSIFVEGYQRIFEDDFDKYPLFRAENIKGTALKFPDGTELSPDPPLIVWSWVGKDGQSDFPTGNALFYVSGNIGIGTSLPSSLLHLSSRSSEGTRPPVITFDLDAVDHYSLGMVQGSPGQFQIDHGGTLGSGVTPFILDGDSLGVGIEPTENLHVSGTMFWDGNVGIGTPVDSRFSLSVPSMSVTRLFLDGAIISAGGTPWDRSGNDIFYDTALDPLANPPRFTFVGIGVTNPTVELEVGGTLNVVPTPGFASIRISNSLDIDDSLTLDGVFFRDTNPSLGQNSRLFVDRGNLFLSGLNILTISDIFTQGFASPGLGGELALWAENPRNVASVTSDNIDQLPEFTVLIRSPLFWNTPTQNQPGKLSFDHFFQVSRNHTINNANAEMSISIGPENLDQSVLVTSKLTHDGDLLNSRSFTASGIHFTAPAWALTPTNPDNEIRLRGLNIEMENRQFDNNDTSLADGSIAIGLRSDVSQVSLQTVADPGRKFSALFLNNASGNVGVGRFPTVELDVAGTVSANSFEISRRISITTINMLSDLIVVDTDKKMIFRNFFDKSRIPVADLDIDGDVSANHVAISGGTTGQSLTLTNANFITHANGKVGMGTTALDPDGTFKHWELDKVFTSLPSEGFTFQSIIATANFVGTSTGDFTGVSINFRSHSSPNLLTDANRLGGINGEGNTVHGYKVDLTNLEISTNRTITGLSVKMADTEVSRNAAIFLGGNVGIGTTVPSASFDLEVEGTIIANSFINVNLLTRQEAASFNQLLVSDTKDPIVININTPNVLIGDLMTARRVNVLQLVQPRVNIQELLNLPNLQLNVVNSLVSTAASFNTRVSANQIVISDSVTGVDFQSSTLGIGTAAPSTGLAVVGGVTASSMVVSDNLSAGSFSVSGSTIVVDAIGTGIRTQSNDINDVSVETTPDTPNTFSASDRETWNAVQVQTATGTANFAAGLALIPDVAIGLSNGGSGVVALRSSNVPTGSHLAFIADPASGASSEAMRLLESGNVGIGTASPTELFVVNGDSQLNGFTVPTLNASTLAGINGLTISSTLNVISTFSITQGLRSETFASFRPIAHASAVDLHGGIYVNSTDNRLYYVTQVSGGDVVRGELGVTTSVGVNSFPYYGDDHTLLGTSELAWSTANVDLDVVGTFSVGSSNALTIPSGSSLVLLTSDISSTNTNGSIRLSEVHMGFNARTNASSSFFRGLDISAGGAGVLNPVDRAYGLLVNMDESLDVTNFSPNGTPVNGTKIAATFIVGSETSSNVSIITSSNTEIVHPSADLYVLANTDNSPGLRVVSLDDGNVSREGLAVTANGFVGIGDISGQSTLLVKGHGNTNDTSTLLITNSADSPLLSINDEGSIGVGVAPASDKLSVAGSLRARNGRFDGIVGDTLSINTENAGLTVLNNGFVGIGTTQPSAQLHMSKQFDRPSELTSTFSFQTLDLDLNTNANADMTGLEIHVSANTGSSFGDGASNRTIEGMSVDLTGITTASDVDMVGFKVENTGAGTRRSAILLGGFVGVGVTQPTAELHVNGLLQGNDISVDGLRLDLNTATYNNLTINNESSFERLTISSPNLLSVSGNFTFHSSERAISVFNQALNKTLNATRLLSDFVTINRVVVGTTNSSNTTTAFVVSGNVSATSTITVSGVTTINALSGINGLSLPTATIQGSTTVNQSLVSNTLYFTPITSLSEVSTNGRLYVDDATKSLFYGIGSTTANLSQRVTGRSARLPYYNSDRNLDDGSLIDRTSQTIGGIDYDLLSIGTRDAQVIPSGNSQFAIIASLNRTALPGSFTLNTISSVFLDRTTADDSLFYGLDIGLGNNGNSQLRTNDVAYGLFIDMHESLDVTNFAPDGSPVNGLKIAATFLGGTDTSANVGIITSTNASVIHPSSDLHVVNTIANHLSLKVDGMTDAGATVNGLVVTNNSINLGLTTGNARLHVLGTVSMVDSAGASLLRVLSNGNVGIGTATPLADLDVNGSLNADNFIGLGVSANSLTVNPTTNALIVTNQGLVGIGTSQPGAQLDLVKTFSVPASLNAAFALQSLRPRVAFNNATQNVTGLGVQLRTNTRSLLDTTGINTVSGRGLKVNMTSLVATSDANVIGVLVGGLTSSNRVSAVFMGGNVGVGRTNPASSLDIAGDLRGRNLTLTNADFTLDSATLNTVIVSSDVSIQTLRTSSTLLVPTTLNIGAFSDRVTFVHQGSEATLSTNRLISDYASLNAVAVGITSNTLPAGIQFGVSGNVAITGNLAIRTQVTANTIFGGTDSLIISPNSTLFISAVTTNITSGNFSSLATGFSSIATPNVVSGSGTLFASNDGNNLAYIGSADVSANLTGQLSGRSFRLPFYGDDLELSDLAFVNYITATQNLPNRLSIGTENSLIVNNHTLSEFTSLIASTNQSITQFTQESIQMAFANRTTSFTPTPSFKGVEIVLTGNITGNSTAMGLDVNLLNLQVSSTTQLPRDEDFSINGIRRAAVFRTGAGSSGNVGIVTSFNPTAAFIPSASLHVVSNVEQHHPLIIADVNGTHLVISHNSQVSIGSDEQGAGLFIKASSASSANSNLLFKNSSDATVFSGNNGGFYGIGTSSPQSLLHVVNSNANTNTLHFTSLSVSGNQTQIVMSPTGNLGIGTTAARALVDVDYVFDNFDKEITFKGAATSGAGDGLWAKVGSAQDPYFNPLFPNLAAAQTFVKSNFHDCPAGQEVFLGLYTHEGRRYFYQFICHDPATGVSPPDLTASYSIPSPILQITNASGLGLFFERNGSLGINTSPLGIEQNTTGSTELKVIVSGNVLSGDFANNVLPSQLIPSPSSMPWSIGHVALNKDTFNYFGLVNHASPNSLPGQYTPYFIWGDDTATDLVFRAQNAASEVMRMKPTGMVGIGTSVPSSNLDIIAPLNSHALRIDTVATASVLTVNDGGFVGIGLNTATSNLVVSGTVQANTLIDTPKGSQLTVIGMVASNNSHSAQVSKVDTVVNVDLGGNATYIAEDVNFSIANDINTVELVGVDISISGVASVNSTHDVHGLKIDVSDVFTEDPTFSGSDGFKYAASFEGAPVGIGNRAPTGGVLFNVFSMDISGNATATGDIVLFRSSTTNGTIDAVNHPNGFTNGSFTIGSSGSVTINAFVDPLVFRTISTMDDADSRRIWQDLSNNLFLEADGTPSRNFPGNVNALQALDNAFYTASVRSQITAIINKHIKKEIFYMKSSYDRTPNNAGLTDVILHLGSGYDGSVLTDAEFLNSTNFGSGHVAIGVPSVNAASFFDKALSVSGDIRIGIVTENIVGVGAAGFGARLFFSGSPITSINQDSENSDQIWIARRNQARDESELVISLGESVEEFASAKLSLVRPTVNGDVEFTSFVAGVFHYVDPATAGAAFDTAILSSLPGEADGRVGMNISDPQATLHVFRSSSADYAAIGTRGTAASQVEGIATAHAMIIENTATGTQPQSLLIHSTASNAPGTGGNFISFVVPSANSRRLTLLGAIEGDGNRGVQFASPEADYAEYLPLLNPEESLEGGDIIGVYDGKITKSTDGASHLMIMSSAPIIAGNWPGLDASGHGLVAFMGQVPVKVRGAIEAGDYILDSGLGDGIGVGIHPDHIRSEDLSRIVARAWESSPFAGVKRVNSLVGFPFKVQHLANQLRQMNVLKEELLSLKDETNVLKTKYDSILMERERQINRLKQYVTY